MANFRSSIFSIINWSNIWSLSSNKSVKNSTSRGSKKVALFTIVLTLSACTIGEEETKGVVSIDENTVSTTIFDEVTFEEGVLNFAQCMREEGINFPDPTFDIDGNPQFDNVDVENEEEFEEAFTNCEDILRNALPEQFDLDPEVEAALVDASLEFSQCMREEGISNFPDPTPGEFGFFAFRDAEIEWTSDDVQEAFEICQPENPLENLDE
ncbi:hypothetical protein OA181_03370 [Acidimicrobiaceae bacterium]|nr:hypothetical protein [Acidimicrobiaceae bacterium]